MGLYYATCKCGNVYQWLSFNAQTIYQGKQCSECWARETKTEAPNETITGNTVNPDAPVATNGL
jgi:hypothetical protein